MDEQKRMIEFAEHAIWEVYNEQEGRINFMMQPEYYDCSFEKGTISFRFPILEWEGNRVMNLHGGALASQFDFTIGALARFYAGEHFIPTVSLDMKYVRPAKVGDHIIVTASKVNAGRKITQLTCEAVNEETGKIIATGASVYINVDTDKERRK